MRDTSLLLIAGLIVLPAYAANGSHDRRGTTTEKNEAAVAAGPIGRTTKVATDAQMHAQILSWSRSRGLIVGASLSGTVIRPDAKATDEFYDKPTRTTDILSNQAVPVPASARSFVNTTDTCARRF
jgi:lipid-binding SYLF domain-containing protein